MYMLPVFILLIIGCAKVPDKIESPGVKIDIIKEDNKEVYFFRFSGGIKNSNTDVAFTDYKGKAVFKEAGDKGKVIRSVDIDLKAILPLDSAIIDTKSILKDEEVQPLLKLLDIDWEKLKKEKSAEKFDIDEKHIGLQNVSFNKKCIIDLLKEKLNEKN